MISRNSPGFRFAAPSRRSRWKGALAVGVAVAVVMAVGLVAVPKDRASATTAGTGACASTVDGLTVQAANLDYGKCGVLVTAGSGTWTVPDGVTEVEAEILAGGGGAGNFGGGGGGEIILVDGYTPGGPSGAVTPGQSIAISIGAGGTGGNHVTAPTNGADSTFGTLTAKGGGAGGNWDPVTGVGTPGAAGGSGGGGAPTAIVAEQANPGVVKGAAGGASTSSGVSRFGRAGGAGAGTRTNYKFGTPYVSYSNFLAGGAGGSAGNRPDRLPPEGALAGPYVGGTGANDLDGGYAVGGRELSIAGQVLQANGSSSAAVTGTGGYGRGGGGGVAASDPGGSIIGIFNPGNYEGTDYNAGGGEITAIDDPPKTPRANSGQGGGGGGSISGFRFGSDGASGLVAISWRPGGAGAPTAPTNVSGTPGNGSADVSWTAPDSDGGSAITDYGVEWSTDGGTTWNPASMCTGAATTCTVTGLRNGTDYVFHVSATNANGTGPWSDPSGTVRPGTGPNFTG